MTTIQFTIQVDYRRLIPSLESMPFATLRLFGRGDLTVDLPAMLDSGAAYTMLPKLVAEGLGLDWSTGRPFPLSGLGRDVTGYLHTLRAQVFPMLQPITCSVVFCDKTPYNLNIIGRHDIFGQLLIAIDERNRRTYLALSA